MSAAPVLDMVSHSPDETRRVGALLGALLAPGDVLLLEGRLGAGKTVFAQGVAIGLGVADPVTSPTFTLIHEHAGRVPMYHVDLYRLAGDTEAALIGLQEYLGGNGVAVVEWPERAAGLMPPEHLRIVLLPGEEDDTRLIRLTAAGNRPQELQGALARGTRLRPTV